jgi:hypothetical protein
MDQDQWIRPAFIVLSAKDIAIRAYEMYETRGAVQGFDRDDWLRAEQELKRRHAGSFRHGVIGGTSM